MITEADSNAAVTAMDTVAAVETAMVGGSSLLLWRRRRRRCENGERTWEGDF